MINDTIFNASINVTTVVEREIFPLAVQVEIGLIFGDADPFHQAVGLERVRFFLNNILNQAIICSRENPISSELKGLTDTRVVDCWDDPWDQFIALMIHFKVTAILEGAATIDYIKVSGNSIASDLDFKYYTKDFPSTMIGSDEDVPPQELWYHRPDTTVNEETDLEMTWKMIGMGWEQEETPAPHINNIKKFTPKIIK